MLSGYNVIHCRSQLQALQSPPEPNLRHRGIEERRANTAREWPGQAEEFRKWCELGVEDEDDNAVLPVFCYGGPGVSKTFLMSCETTTGGDKKVCPHSTNLL